MDQKDPNMTTLLSDLLRVTQPESNLHAALSARGERWLRSVGCRVVLREPFKAAVYTGEQPDVIGWRDGLSILIECKVSRSDFLADRSKPFRKQPELGMGDFRLYLAPPGVLTADDMPEGWGLLVAHDRRIEVVGPLPRQYAMKSYGVTRKDRRCFAWHPRPFTGNKQCETVMLVSALARQTTNGQQFGERKSK